jgi:hypothetical protein
VGEVDVVVAVVVVAVVVVGVVAEVVVTLGEIPSVVLRPIFFSLVSAGRESGDGKLGV